MILEHLTGRGNHLPSGLVDPQTHDHLHDLDLGVRLAGVDVTAVLDDEVEELAGGRGAEDGRVVLLLEDAGLDPDGDAVAMQQENK